MWQILGVRPGGPGYDPLMLAVRPPTFQDLAALLSLYSHLHRTDAPIEPSRATSIWHELQTNPRHRHFGAFIGGALVSSCAITVIPNLTRGGRAYAVIENVVTDAAYRRQGAAAAVLQAALAFAWDQQCHKVELSTGRMDDDIRAFYVSCGLQRGLRDAYIARSPVVFD